LEGYICGIRRYALVKIIGVPYIVRNIPTYDILSEENLVRIEKTADRILAEIGIEFRDDPGRARPLAARRREGRRRAGQVRAGHAARGPEDRAGEFTQHARNPANNRQIGGKNVVFAPAYGSPFVMDLDKGRRYGTIEDFRTSSSSRSPRPGCTIPAARSASRSTCR
jgi:trimethylamine--corrinoid protein Co-methyltransferase